MGFDIAAGHADSIPARDDLPERKPPTFCGECASRPMCLLSGLGPQERDAVAADITLHKYRPGQRITTEGDIPADAHMVKVGTVFGYRRGIDGTERPIGIAGRGAMFGLFALLQQPNQVSTIAASTVYVCTIPAATLRRLVAASPSFAREVAAGTTRMWAFFCDWSGGMRVQGLTNQLAYALAMLGRTQHSQVVQLPTRAALGQLLGAGRETVSRALATLAAEGRIELLPGKRCGLRHEKLLARLRAGDSADPGA